MSPDPKQLLAHVEEIARLAGAVLMKHFRQLEGYEKKGAIDLLTVADKESEALVIREIQRRFPDQAILAEEGGRAGNAQSETLWVIDPLDGTTNYAHGMRLFAVSIGVAHAGELIAGAVFGPALDEMYLASKGGGAALNGKPIHVSQTEELGDALLVTGFPYTRAEQADALMEMVRAGMVNGQGILRLGAAALDFANVAAGNLDGFYEWGLKPWDIAAGTLLVREAGGTVTGLRPDEEFDLFSGHITATNGRIHEELRRVIAPGSTRLP